MLLYSLKKQFNLPALFIKVGDGLGIQVMSVGDESILIFLLLIVEKDDPSGLCFYGLANHGK